VPVFFWHISFLENPVTIVKKLNIIMKKLIVAFALQVIVFASVAQTNPIKVVFDITSKDTLAHQGELRHMADASWS
jgi:hypothetical protein